MEKFIYLVADKVLKPCFGEAWLAVTGWICVIALLALLAAIFYVIVKYNKNIVELNNCKESIDKLTDDNEYLMENKKDLELTLNYVKGELEKEKETNQTLNTTIENLNKAIVKKDVEIKNLKITIKEEQKVIEKDVAKEEQEPKAKTPKKKSSKKVEKLVDSQQ